MTAGELYVVGGKQRTLIGVTESVGEWYEYDKGLVLRVDPATGTAVAALEYVSPPEVCPPGENPPILFKSGTIVGDTFYACTQTEVLVYRLPDFELLHYVTSPAFNDVHHVRPTPTGNLLIADTGLDMVLEMTTAGEVVHEWNVLGEDPWARFSRDIDYRKVRTTKPHLAHPNHVFYVDGEPWAARFQQKDAICLTHPERRIEIGVERVHDGTVRGGRIYFTAVNGRVIVADAAELRVVDIIDLAAIHGDDMLLGWCRGVLPEGDRAWVGFSRVRQTKIRENISWIRRGLKKTLGTHIAEYDLASRQLVRMIDLEPFGMSAVFSIHPVTGDA